MQITPGPWPAIGNRDGARRGSLWRPEREHGQPEEHDRDDGGEKRRHGGTGTRPAEPVGRPRRDRQLAQPRSRMCHGLCLLAWLGRRPEPPSPPNPPSTRPPPPPP